MGRAKVLCVRGEVARLVFLRLGHGGGARVLLYLGLLESREVVFLGVFSKNRGVNWVVCFCVGVIKSFPWRQKQWVLYGVRAEVR